MIASARLNSATNALGDLDELYVIASAVVGGTSLAGGVGTIYGAISGALVLGEVLHWQDWAAVVLMVLSIAAVLWPARPADSTQ